LRRHLWPTISAMHYHKAY